jgi:hypothetical protein
MPHMCGYQFGWKALGAGYGKLARHLVQLLNTKLSSQDRLYEIRVFVWQRAAREIV